MFGLVVYLFAVRRRLPALAESIIPDHFSYAQSVIGKNSIATSLLRLPMFIDIAPFGNGRFITPKGEGHEFTRLG